MSQLKLIIRGKIMMVKKKITKCIVGIVCLLSITVLGSKTEIRQKQSLLTEIKLKK